MVKTKSDHHNCPISVHILTTSKSEAVEIGCGWQGGGSPCCTSCPDNHSRRRVRQVAQDSRERGGLCTQDNSVHRSHVPLSLPFSFAFCLLFPLSHQCLRSALVLMLIRNKGFEYYQKLKSTADNNFFLNKKMQFNRFLPLTELSATLSFAQFA